MEAFKAKGYEVLVLADAIDEVWADMVAEFDGKPLRSIAKGQVDLDDATADGDEEAKPDHAEFDGLLAYLTGALGEQVKEARLSTRLTTSPACLVGDAQDLTPALEKLYRAMGRPVPHTKRILELNPDHPYVTALREAYARDGEGGTGSESESESLKQTAELLYGLALLAEGGELEDPARFSRLLADRLAPTV